MNIKKLISITLLFALLLSAGIYCFADDDPSIIIVTPESSEYPAVSEDPSPSPSETVSPEVTTSPEVTASPEVTVSPTPTANPYPVVTKDPTSENVYTDGRAVFIARADNATSITWYLISSDGVSTILASSIPQLFTGVQVTGCDSEKLVITNPSVKLSGYKAFARFGNENGYTDSACASLTVTIAPSPTVTPTIAPTPTTAVTPSPAAAASPTIMPTEVPSQTPSVTAVPSADDSADTESHSGSSVRFGTVLLLIISVVVIVGAATVLALYVKGKINLTWLENILSREKSDTPDSKSDIPDERDTDGSSENEVDIPHNFYDPEDYK